MKNNIDTNYLDNYNRYDELKTLKLMIESVEEKEEEQKELEEVAKDNDARGVSSSLRDKTQSEFHTKQEIEEKKNQSAKEIEELQNKINDILKKMNYKDYNSIKEEGISIKDYTVDGLLLALRRAKLKESNTEELNKDKEIQAKINSAIDISQSIGEISPKAKAYLVGNNLAPTIENVYKSNHIGDDDLNEAVNINDAVWAEISPKAAKELESQGMEPTDEIMEQGRWLVGQDIPFTKNNLEYLNNLENIDLGEEGVRETVIKGVEKGIEPMDVQLWNNESDLETLVNDIKGITDESVDYIKEENGEVNLGNLIEVTDKLDSVDQAPMTDSKLPSNAEDIEAITAKRQLEEIRLKMTVEAAQRLESKGIKIETEELGKVVEELKAIEDEYYANVLRERDIDPTEEQVNNLRDTIEIVDEVKSMPSHLLGSTFNNRNIATIEDIYQEGVGKGDDLDIEESRLHRLEWAMDEYEKFRTVPSAEYGDSINKAFANIGTLLGEMGIEKTLFNERAVRILAYNQMEVNHESLDQMKAYDLEVNALFRNLTPAITAELIKDGINPLNISINELNNRVNDMQKEQADYDEKYSEFLFKLEKDGQISEPHRKAYIGIYRLINQVEKTDGAALGLVIKSNREITLGNLLTATRTIKHGHMDYAVDDEFGELEEIIKSRESITDQIEQGYTEEVGFREEIVEKVGEEKEEEQYSQRLVGEILKEITPDKLHALESHINENPHIYGEDSLNTILEMPLDQFYEEILGAEARAEQEIEQVIREQVLLDQVQEIKDILRESSDTVRFLKHFKLPGVMENIEIGKNILDNKGDIYKKLRKWETDGVKKFTKKPDIYLEKEEIDKSYGELEKEIEEAIDIIYDKRDLSSQDLDEIQSVRSQIRLSRELAKKQFYQIPMELDGEVVNINLTIINNKSNTGGVKISLQPEALGRVDVEFNVKDHYLKGSIITSNQKSLDLLVENKSRIIQIGDEAGFSIKQIDFGLEEKARMPYFTNEDIVDKDSANSDLEDSIEEKNLYQLAKETINLIANLI